MKRVFDYPYDDLFNPTLQALHNLGGSGTIDEIEEEVIKILNLTEEQINDIHKGNKTRLSYRLGWSRTYLKQYGLIENSSRGVWALTETGFKNDSVDKELVRKFVQTSKPAKSYTDDNVSTEITDEIVENEEIQNITWQEGVIEILQNISPSAFEILCQRMLRELGFDNVEVTGKSNDGGIDGKGLLKIGGVLSFHVIFQAKRYKGSVSPSIVRDFRGAMVGRADKGLIITTGTFTREAKKEAQRDGAPPIDLIDGMEFAEKLKELKLGVEVELIEKVIIKKEWFDKFNQ